MSEDRPLSEEQVNMFEYLAENFSVIHDIWMPTNARYMVKGLIIYIRWLEKELDRYKKLLEGFEKEMDKL